MVVRHELVLVAVDGEDGRQTGAHVGERRHAPGDLVLVRKAAEPRDRQVGGVGAIDRLGHIGGAEPVDGGGDFRYRRGPGALASSTSAGAGAMRASRRSTFTTFQPISIHGMSDISEPSFEPAAPEPAVEVVGRVRRPLGRRRRSSDRPMGVTRT